VIGIVAGILISGIAMWLAIRKQFRASPRALLAGSAARDEAAAPGAFPFQRAEQTRAHFKLMLSTGAAIFCVLCAAAIVVFGSGAGAFFSAGALLLIAGFLAAYRWLKSLETGAMQLHDIRGLGVRNAARRAARSMTIIMVLASGVFIVVAVDSFRQRASASQSFNRLSGTGGFALVGESSLPIYDDLNAQQGRQSFGLDDRVMEDVRIVPMRLREGDDASCLNLNRALQPRLLGVNAKELAQLRAFRGSRGKPVDWTVLDREESDAFIPAIVDQSTLQWALQKKLGDTMEFHDERGAPFQVRFAAVVTGSILQGQLLIAENRFLQKYPSHGGYRFFLIDTPAGRLREVSAALSRALQDRGLELAPAWQRLAELQAVENTYLSIFQVLGGLGMLLGSVGLAVVVARNVLERRREFALLEAVGFRQAQLRRLLFAEHRALILFAIVVGVMSALIAVWPGLRERVAGFPWREMSLLVIAILAASLFWTWLASRIALRGSRVAALRSE
jgi:hypothetical protein